MRLLYNVITWTAVWGYDYLVVSDSVRWKTLFENNICESTLSASCLDTSYNLLCVSLCSISRLSWSHIFLRFVRKKSTKEIRYIKEANNAHTFNQHEFSILIIVNSGMVSDNIERRFLSVINNPPLLLFLFLNDTLDHIIKLVLFVDNNEESLDLSYCHFSIYNAVLV